MWCNKMQAKSYRFGPKTRNKRHKTDYWLRK